MNNLELKNDNGEEQSNTVKFTCAICAFEIDCCRYGFVKNYNGRTHAYRYQEEVYYMMDPFRNRRKADPRRLAAKKPGTGSSRTSGGGDNISSILDIFVLGAVCSICGQAVCIDESCSIFYTKTFCTACVIREKAQFPQKVVEQVETARKVRENSKQNERKHTEESAK